MQSISRKKSINSVLSITLFFQKKYVTLEFRIKKTVIDFTEKMRIYLGIGMEIAKITWNQLFLKFHKKKWENFSHFVSKVSIWLKQTYMWSWQQWTKVRIFIISNVLALWFRTWFMLRSGKFGQLIRKRFQWGYH